jgi:SAM-dependent methyltransferase
VAFQGRRLTGLVVNIGSGTDDRQFGRRVIRVDAFAPSPTVRADLVHHLPFIDGAFDGGLCTEVIEHVPDARWLLSELARVMKSGARAVITVPFAFHYHPDPSDFLRLTPEGLRLELSRAGFEVELLTGVGGKLVAFMLLLEGSTVASKVIVRLAALLVVPLLSSTPRHDRWSDWAANSVAVVIKRADANR